MESKCAETIAKHYYSIPNKTCYLDLVKDIFKIYELHQEEIAKVN